MALYRLDGKNMKTEYGISVLRCTGNLDMLKRKGASSHSWPDEDGEEAFTDADDIVFGPRDISLVCVLRQPTKATFLTKLSAFKHVLESSGLHTLYIDTTGVTHSVFCIDGGSVTPLTKWNPGIMAGQFTLKLREPVPARAT